MSGAHRPSRKSTDFTIARILSDDSADHSTFQNINSVRTHSPLDRQLCSNSHNDRDRNCHRSQDDSDTQDSESLFKVTHEFRENKMIESTSTSKIDQRDVEIKIKNNISPFSTAQLPNNLHWLQCTRYQPPKLPRKSFAERVSRRRSAAHPRIPFTSYQLQVLEDKYKSGAYLSRKDVIQLSTTLRIPNSRIKIWFQNRRARDRRETKVTSGLSVDEKHKM